MSAPGTYAPRCHRVREGQTCGAALIIDDCSCCSVGAWRCPKCVYVEVRDGQRFAAPFRCMVCAKAGCRYESADTVVQRCHRASAAGPQPPRRAV